MVVLGARHFYRTGESSVTRRKEVDEPFERVGGPYNSSDLRGPSFRTGRLRWLSPHTSRWDFYKGAQSPNSIFRPVQTPRNLSSLFYSFFPIRPLRGMVRVLETGHWVTTRTV